MVELTVGQFESMFTRLAEQATARSGMVLAPLALLVEQQAKVNASTGTHPYGTKTPASPGSGPSRISGTLLRSITHSPVQQVGLGWEVRVGIASGAYPTYRTRRGTYTSKTSSSRYGFHLETGLRNGARYPFLLPAFHFVVDGPARLVYDHVFGAGGWLLLA